MNQFVPLSDLPPAQPASATMEIFDPPMCCPTGLCGPTLDQTLLDLNETILKLQSEGVSVVRYQMTSHPNAFLGNAEVMKLIREKQLDALPIIVVKGKVIKTGAYPTMDEIKDNLDGASQ